MHEIQYLNNLRLILDEGTWSDNRTGIRTISLPGLSMRFDLRESDPLVTTKKLALKSIAGELVGFLRATRTAVDFRKFGCKVWDQNANENPDWLANPYRKGPDDLGDIYGVQWRSWPAYKSIYVGDAAGQAQYNDALDRGYICLTKIENGNVAILYKAIDQLRDCVETILKSPGSRRILFHGWNPAKLEEISLPACHLLYQFLPNPSKKELSMAVYIRSNDMGLGAPFNMAEAAMLLHLVARLTGYTARWMSYFIGDAHIYENHLDMVKEQLTRAPLPAGRIQIAERVPNLAAMDKPDLTWLDRIEPTDFTVLNYHHHSAITAPMAV